MLWLTVVGVVALAVAAVLAVLGKRARARVTAIAGTETSRCADVAQAAASGSETRVECAGSAAPGPTGSLTAPFSSRECVWYRATVTEHYWDTERRTDSQGHSTSRRVRRTRQVSDDHSSSPFVLTDDSGSVAVDPRDGRIDRPEKARDEFQDRPREGLLKELVFGSRTIGYQHEEWLIAPGTALFVNGVAVQRADGSALARPPSGGDLIVSTRSEEELLAASRRAAIGWFAGAGVLAVGGLAAAVVGLAA